MHEDTESQTTRRRRRSVKIAISAVIAGGILATSGVAHAGYRWGFSAPRQPTTTTTTAPDLVMGYRWR